MNWDWEKLQEQRQRHGGSGGPKPPNFDDWADKFGKFRGFNFPSGKLAILAALLLWLLSGIYIVEPDEVGVVKRFGAYNRTVQSGPHYHMPYPIESAETPKVTQIRRMEIGFRSVGSDRLRAFQQDQTRSVPAESLMLTGDENIVSVQFIVQYQVKDAQNYLYNISDPEGTVKNAAAAAIREVIGKSKIDDALTTGKEQIQRQTLELMQEILDLYQSGLRILAVQLQNVHPPEEVVDAFKDVASAREDKNRFINEAEAYRNDLIPKTRGQAEVKIKAAEAYRETKILKAQGDAARFLAVFEEYRKAKDVTRKRLYLETMEKILSSPEVEKLIMSDEALRKSIPYLPLSSGGVATAPKTQTPKQ